MNSTYFDQFIKTTTNSPIVYDDDSANFNDTFESINGTDFFNGSQNFLSFGTDVGFENKIENNTKYSEYAEDMFDDNGKLANESKVT